MPDTLNTSIPGLLAGLGGATFVYMHRKIVFLIRNHGHKIFLHKNKYVTWARGPGHVLGGR